MSDHLDSDLECFVSNLWLGFCLPFHLHIMGLVLSDGGTGDEGGRSDHARGERDTSMKPALTRIGCAIPP